MSDKRSPSLLRVFGQPKMAVLLVLGFSSGLPLYFTDKMLQAWMTVEGVKLSTITAFSLVGTPATLKFLWAPLMDRYVPPFLGRRRGWLVITQVAVLVATAAMALHDPRTGLQVLAINAVLIAFFSASQDVVGDAYRTDVAEERETGAAASIWVLGYRIAMLLTGSLAFILADRMSWQAVYVLMALLMLVGVAATLLAPEPVLRARPPQTLADAVVLPFRDFFERAGLLRGIAALLFIVLYKLSDNLAVGLSTPFLLKIGFSQTQVGTVVGGVGLFATIGGSLLGGALVGKMGINRSLWIAGVAQGLSQLGYYWLAHAGRSETLMIVAVLAENIVYGLVTAVFTAFLMSICSKRFSATQYALLSSLMAVSRVWVVAPAGSLAERVGWPSFFMIALAASIPALLLLPFIAPWNREAPVLSAEHSGEVEGGGPDGFEDDPEDALRPPRR
ncbi:MAG TPA: AmpG family muropeptide MFS transporter [Longimicrobiaceae bacterium]|nr:AmpG family muropeptide MFS transporter [Longimicrobiaceae bacterium]